VGSGQKALDIATSENFNLIILDVMLPDMDGFSVCKEIRATDSNTPILFLTALSSTQDKLNGLGLGADDYITKPFNLDEFLLRVKVLVKLSLKGNSKTDWNTYHFGGNEINFSTYNAISFDGTKFSLTKKEADLLRLLINREDTVVSRDTILRIIWGLEDAENMRTVDNFINRFRKYFEVNPHKPVHFNSERKLGYRFIKNPNAK
jgi:two-component system alkaline phosphatase synthesis response regulator PhoP